MGRTNFDQLRAKAEQVRSQTTPPTSPTPENGEVYFESDTDSLFVYQNGIGWVGVKLT